jgi:hypothetical protein
VLSNIIVRGGVVSYKVIGIKDNSKIVVRESDLGQYLYLMFTKSPYLGRTINCLIAESLIEYSAIM